MKFDIEGWCKDNVDGARMTSTGQIVGVCPWCNKDGHFYVDAEKGHYICFKCEQRGRFMIGLIAQVEGVSTSEARRIIMRSEVEFRRKETPQSLMQKVLALRGETESGPPKVDFPLPDEFIPVYKNGHWMFPKYLKERRIKKAAAREWGMGWCDRGRYAGRVVIPVECPNGRSFTARDATGKQQPRYLNPKGADHGRLLLGWNHHSIEGDVCIVEGPIDAIKMWQHGIPALALMGKVLHPEQLALLMLKPADAAITVMLDPEEAKAPYDAAQQLMCRFDNVSIAKLPMGVDPGSSTKQQAFQAYNNAVRYTGERLSRLSAAIQSSQKKLEKIFQ
jgi:DNA primase